jgi:hypothetical protein
MKLKSIADVQKLCGGCQERAAVNAFCRFEFNPSQRRYHPEFKSVLRFLRHRQSRFRLLMGLKMLVTCRSLSKKLRFSRQNWPAKWPICEMQEHYRRSD